MGAFEFTYCLPDNFNKRVAQYLQQFEKPLVAQAFQKCKYEYEDIGFAHYAGLSGDTWNKKALDFTIEGIESDITLLKSSEESLYSAIGRALKPSESGFLIRDIFYFISDDTSLSTTIPPSNEDRLNADMAAAQHVLNDLMRIGERLCLNAAYNASTPENGINDFFRDMLSAKEYDEVKDQTRHGISASGKDAGEVDILLTKSGREVAIFEGLKLDSVAKAYIDEHIDKALVNYNALGTATFIVAYVSSSDFEAFWKRYSAYVGQYNYPLQIKKSFSALPYPNAATRVGMMIVSRDDYDFPVYFIAFRID